jgi:hypothetical protein
MNHALGLTILRIGDGVGELNYSNMDGEEIAKCHCEKFATIITSDTPGRYVELIENIYI